jgi:hypothetical protein
MRHTARKVLKFGQNNCEIWKIKTSAYQKQNLSHLSGETSVDGAPLRFSRQGKWVTETASESDLVGAWDVVSSSSGCQKDARRRFKENVLPENSDNNFSFIFMNEKRQAVCSCMNELVLKLAEEWRAPPEKFCFRFSGDVYICMRARARSPWATFLELPSGTW